MLFVAILQFLVSYFCLPRALVAEFRPNSFEELTRFRACASLASNPVPLWPGIGVLAEWPESLWLCTLAQNTFLLVFPHHGHFQWQNPHCPWLLFRSRCVPAK